MKPEPPLERATDEVVRAVTLALVQDYLRLLSAQQWEPWIALWAEDGELEFPYAPSGRRRLYQGKPHILAYMQGTSGKVAVDGIAYSRVLPMLDPRLACMELGIQGHVPTNGVRYDQTYVAMFETKGGQLWRYREYWNPLISMDAFGGREAWTNAFGNPEEGHTT